MKKIIIFIPLLVLVIILIPKQKLYTKDYFYMDTYINVKLYTTAKKAEIAFQKINDIYSEYHQLTDRYNEYDNITNVKTINNSNIVNTIDKKLYDVIKYGLEWFDNSDGLLNINIGSITDIWKKYREIGNGIPKLEELDKNIDINNIKLLQNNQIEGEYNIDLGAISKGYTTQMVGNYLEENNINKYLINAGGNVLVGKHYRNEKYKIGIKSPNQNGDVFKVINGENIAVVTSGGYERNYIYEGNIYHHIINPHTKYPSSYMKSVTVITKDSAKADALSTILFLMSIEEGMEYINKNYSDVEVIWYTNSDEVITTKGISKYE